ncbi:MAG: type II toxin-antitoxin system RelE/ParE family toxin [Dehalococcoidia bacterium]
MEVEFSSNRLAQCYRQSDRAVRQWGEAVARKYITRIEILYAQPTFDSLRTLRSLRLHPLKGRRQGQYAIDLTGQWRLIVTPGAKEEQVRVEEVTNHYDD